MGSDDMNAVQFGRLLESVQQLTRQLALTSGELEKLDERLQALEGRWRAGKTAVAVAIFMAGSAVYGFKQFLLDLANALGVHK